MNRFGVLLALCATAVAGAGEAVGNELLSGSKMLGREGIEREAVLLEEKEMHGEITPEEKKRMMLLEEENLGRDMLGEYPEMDFANHRFLSAKVKSIDNNPQQAKQNHAKGEARKARVAFVELKKEKNANNTNRSPSVGRADSTAPAKPQPASQLASQPAPQHANAIGTQPQEGAHPSAQLSGAAQPSRS